MIPFHGNTPLGFAAVLAIILFSTKILGLLFKKMGLPQVLGFIIAGILIGPSVFGELINGGRGFAIIGFEDKSYNCLFALPDDAEMSQKLTELFGREVNFGNGLGLFAKIGVLLLMFSAGLETNLKELKSTGPAAILMATSGVLLPLALGFAMSLPFGNIGLGFGGSANIFRCVFIGTILTATSVAITVSVLKELGKIRSKLGTTIVSAAIIDDVIGIVLLSVVTGIAKAGGSQEYSNGFEWFKGQIYGTVIMIVCFFVFAIVAGIGIHYAFCWLEKKRATTHRVPIFSLAVCFIYSWLAEEIFGVADITGAFLAGVVLSTAHRASAYADTKIEVCTYTIFAPVFFANIGISSISFVGLNPGVLLFALLAVLAGLIGKIVGCGAVCRLFKYGWKESAIGGVGMMARGEVALIVTATVTGAALGENALPPQFMIMTVLLILVSSILTPILLKVLYREPQTAGKGGPTRYGPHGDESAPEFPEEVD